MNAGGDESWELQRGHRNSAWLELQARGRARRDGGAEGHGAGPGPTLWGRRGQILTLTQPFLPWGQPEPVRKGMDVVQGQHRTVGLAVLRWGDGNPPAVTASPCTPAVAAGKRIVIPLPPQ